MDFLAYADGRNTLFQICERIGVPLSIVLDEAKAMLTHDLIEMSVTQVE